MLDAAKFTEWVGVYARHRMKEYLGDDMPWMDPPARDGENFDTIMVAGTMVYFWELHNTFLVEADAESSEVSEALRGKIDALASELPQREGEQLERLVEILVALGPVALPSLFDSFAAAGQPTYLHPAIERVVYLMSGDTRQARPVRGSERVMAPLIARIEVEESDEVRARWIQMLGELLHWYPHRAAVENSANSYPPDVYKAVLDVREGAKRRLLEWMESDRPSDQAAALTAYIRVGDADVVEPASVLLVGSDDEKVQIAAARCLGWVRTDESGLAALQATDYQGDEYPPAVRVAIARALVLLAEESPIPVLLEALRNADEAQRRVAVDAPPRAENKVHF